MQSPAPTPNATMQVALWVWPKQIPASLRLLYETMQNILPEVTWQPTNANAANLATQLRTCAAVVVTGPELATISHCIAQDELAPAPIVIAIGSHGTDANPAVLLAERHQLEDGGAAIWLPANTVPSATQRRLRQAFHLAPVSAHHQQPQPTPNTAQPGHLPQPQQPLPPAAKQLDTIAALPRPEAPVSSVLPAATPSKPSPDRAAAAKPQPSQPTPAEQAALPAAVILPIGYQAPEQEMMTVLWQLAQQRYTGPVRLHHSRQILRGFWQEGQPCWLHTNLESEQFPAFLLRRGHLQRQNMAQLPHQPDWPAQQWAAWLIEQQWLTQAELAPLLQTYLQVLLRQWIATETGTLHRGDWDPIHHAGQAYPPIPLTSRPQAWLLDGMLHSYRSQRYWYYLGSKASVLQPTSQLTGCKQAMRLSAHHTHILHRCDGVQSIESLLADYQEREAEILALLATCCLLGALTIISPQQTHKAPHHLSQVESDAMWAWHERAKRENYFDMLSLPFDATNYAIEQAINEQRQQLQQWKDRSPHLATQPWQQIATILEDAAYVLLEGKRRQQYGQALLDHSELPKM